MSSSDTLDPLQAFAELGRINYSVEDLSQVLSRISELAKRTVPGAAEVSVSLLRDGKASTAASTGPLAQMCDDAQYDKGHGPCLEAGQGSETVVIHDMSTETRWPDFTPEAAKQGAGSSVSVGLPVQEPVTGALNIYATRPHAFDDEAIDVAQSFAGYAAVALANAHLYDSTAALARQMQDAMKSRAVIEQAKGVLIAQQGCSVEEAFDMLSRASQTSNQKLRDLAAAIVEGAQKGKPQD